MAAHDVDEATFLDKQYLGEFAGFIGNGYGRCYDIRRLLMRSL